MFDGFATEMPLSAPIDQTFPRISRILGSVRTAKHSSLLHADDVEWINAYARLFQDAASLGEFIEQRLFPAFDSAVSQQEIANMRAISVRYVGDDAAVVHMYTDGERGVSRNAGKKMRRTHIHLVLEKQQCDWKIVHTAIMDAR